MNAHDVLKKLTEGKDLTTQETKAFLTAVMQRSVSPTLIAAILTALRMKVETAEEIVGLVEAMREKMVRVHVPGAIDVVGTGGDGSNTFNVSTTTALVVAGAGVPVAKHGNRAASSKCGSADVLEALGVNIQLTKNQAEAVFNKVGFVFLLAPLFHPATKEVVGVRKELKIRTIFNVLGPLLNPASTKRQLLGVPDSATAKLIAKVATKLSYQRLLIVTSNGTDEVTTSHTTHCVEVRGKRVRSFTVNPQKYGFKKPKKGDIHGGDAHTNAILLRSVLSGEKGPRRDIVLLNSACALLVAGRAISIADGIRIAEHSIDSGAAQHVLEQLIRETKCP